VSRVGLGFLFNPNLGLFSRKGMREPFHYFGVGFDGTLRSSPWCFGVNVFEEVWGRKVSGVRVLSNPNLGFG
jgi:hypothetical protein